MQSNENAAPVKQAIHQRHKSAGNLKTMPTTGALNAPPKRTVFGDVSNLARAYGEIGAKDALKSRVKSVVTTVNSRDTRVDDKENARVSIAGPKGQSNASVSSNAVGATNKPAVRGNSLQSQQANSSGPQLPVIKPAVFKKATAVYQDKREYSSGARAEVGSSIDDLLGLMGQIKNPRHYKSQPHLKSEQPVLRRTQSRLINVDEKLIEIEDEEDVADDATDATYEDAVERLPEDLELYVQQDAAGSVDDNHNRTVHVNFDDELQVASYAEPSKAVKSLHSHDAETDEYWDEDEEQEQDQDQEYYDEQDQGYTTGHSYRSHGDNTTGAVTTLVVPKVTTMVQKQLDMAKVFVLQHQTEDEIDEEAWDVSMVAEYGEEIFGYMRELEAGMLPNPHYMEIQTEIQWSMRSVLMDWLVQVHHRFSLLPETLFLTVNYIDRFLSVKIVSLGKLQLVGATAIFVAAKYEEINCPSVQEIVYMVDEGYSIEEILKAERFMLSMLQFELGWPGPMSFLRRISKADDYDLETRTLAKYFLEVTIMDERFVGCPPSFIAAGAHCLARMMLRKGEWTLSHVHYSGYTMDQLRPLLAMLVQCCENPRKHHGAVFDKYAGSRYKNASTFVEGEMGKGFSLPSLVPQLSSCAILDDDSQAIECKQASLFDIVEA
ncbi:cyclin-like protein [Podospora didyma]|uniref:Cyclin-like protein n=1 Tax=Podospora didyma TaxID=330526 RepID=A0AAE0ND72_9PEZI|nr:cyclin-like protein [Podospora didyma]